MPKMLQIAILVCTAFLVLRTAYFYFFINKPKATKYGINYSAKYARELGLNSNKAYLDILDNLNPKLVRLNAYWDEIETSPESYNFSEINWQISQAQKRNIEVILALGRKVPRWPECHDPVFIKNQSEEEIKNKLLLLIKEEVLNFRNFPNIKYYQVENEPFFPFGECPHPLGDREFIKKEIKLVKELDSNKKILIQDSGETGIWPLTKSLGDILGISMYKFVVFNPRIINLDIYITYPLPHWYYRLKASFFGINTENIIITELQAEPWGTKPIGMLSKEEIEKTASYAKFNNLIEISQKSGFSNALFWGVEWWYKQKELGDSFYFDTAKKAMLGNP